MEISRDSECNEHQWCEAPEDRQDHSRDHVEEECERESNKRKDGTFHRHNTTTCTTHHYTPARKHEWRFDVISLWRLDHGTLVPLRRKTVGGSTARPRARDTSHRYEM